MYRTMIEDVVKELIKRKITISFAESCTGGSLASALTRIPGSSNIFKGSFVTYSIEYKEKYLGVRPDVIKEFGVVSREVAEEMCFGLYSETGTDIAVSTTGNAGPTAGDEKEPVGTIFVGIKYQNKMKSFELNLEGNREENIQKTVDFVFSTIGKLIEESL